MTVPTFAARWILVVMESAGDFAIVRIIRVIANDDSLMPPLPELTP
jgi:hypothetical protein